MFTSVLSLATVTGHLVQLVTALVTFIDYGDKRFKPFQNPWIQAFLVLNVHAAFRNWWLTLLTPFLTGFNPLGITMADLGLDEPSQEAVDESLESVSRGALPLNAREKRA